VCVARTWMGGNRPRVAQPWWLGFGWQHHLTPPRWPLACWVQPVGTHFCLASTSTDSGASSGWGVLELAGGLHLLGRCLTMYYWLGVPDSTAAAWLQPQPGLCHGAVVDSVMHTLTPRFCVPAIDSDAGTCPGTCTHHEPMPVAPAAAGGHHGWPVPDSRRCCSCLGGLQPAG
jgi:hypothetical protein